jgi:hypothetical protein
MVSKRTERFIAVRTARMPRAPTTLSTTPHMRQHDEEYSMTNSSIEWGRDIDAALEQAKREHRPILIDFTAAPN